MKPEFHRWDFLLYWNFSVGEWRKAEILHVTNAHGFVYYKLRDIQNNKIVNIGSEWVKKDPAYS